MSNEVGGLHTRGLFPTQRVGGGGAGDWDKSKSLTINLDTINALAGLLGHLTGNKDLAKGELIPTASVRARQLQEQLGKDNFMANMIQAGIVPDNNDSAGWSAIRERQGLPPSAGGDVAALPTPPSPTPISAPDMPSAPPSGPLGPPEQAGAPQAPPMDMALNAVKGVPIMGADVPLSGGETAMGLKPPAPPPAALAPPPAALAVPPQYDAGIQAAAAPSMAPAVMPASAAALPGEQPDISALALQMMMGGGNTTTSGKTRVSGGSGLSYFGKAGTSGTNPLPAAGRMLYQQAAADRRAKSTQDFQREKAATEEKHADRSYDLEMDKYHNQRANELFNQMADINKETRANSGENRAVQAQQNDTMFKLFNINKEIGLTAPGPDHDANVARLMDEYNSLAMTLPKPRVMQAVTEPGSHFWNSDTKKIVIVPLNPDEQPMGKASEPATAKEVTAPQAAVAEGPGLLSRAASGVKSVVKDLVTPAPNTGGPKVKNREIKDALEGRSQYEPLIRQHAEANGVPLPIARAVVGIESAFKPDAKGVGSDGKKTSARGLMQMTDAAAADEKLVNKNDPNENLKAGLTRFGRYWKQTGGDLERSYLMYHDGPNSMAAKYGVKYASPDALKVLPKLQKWADLAGQASTEVPATAVAAKAKLASDPRLAQAVMKDPGIGVLVEKIGHGNLAGLPPDDIRQRLARGGATPQQIATAFQLAGIS